MVQIGDTADFTLHVSPTPSTLSPRIGTADVTSVLTRVESKIDRLLSALSDNPTAHPPQPTTTLPPTSHSPQLTTTFPPTLHLPQPTTTLPPIADPPQPVTTLPPTLHSPQPTTTFQANMSHLKPQSASNVQHGQHPTQPNLHSTSFQLTTFYAIFLFIPTVFHSEDGDWAE